MSGRQDLQCFLSALFNWRVLSATAARAHNVILHQHPDNIEFDTFRIRLVVALELPVSAYEPKLGDHLIWLANCSVDQELLTFHHSLSILCPDLIPHENTGSFKLTRQSQARSRQDYIHESLTPEAQIRDQTDTG